MMKRFALFISLLLLNPAAYSKDIWLICEGFDLDTQAPAQFSIRIDEDRSRAWWFADNVTGDWEYVKFSADFIKYSSVSTSTFGPKGSYRFSWRINRSNGVYEDFFQWLPYGENKRNTFAICKPKKNMY